MELIRSADTTELALADLTKSAASYIEQSDAAATRRAYATSWRQFEDWCVERKLCALPATPDCVALYVAYLADARRRPATIQRTLAAIAKRHSGAGYPNPASLKHASVSGVWRGAKRVLGMAQNQKAPVLVDQLRAMMANLPESLVGKRDHALLLVGFASACRRSELVALEVADLAEVAEGYRLTIRKSKTDQESRGRVVGIPYGSTLATCPVRAVKAWLAAAGIGSGRLLRSVTRGKLGESLSDRMVAKLVKKHADLAGLDPALFAGHSLRAGMATAAAIADVSERDIQRQTGHASAAMLRRYIRDADIWRSNPITKLGL